MFPPQSLKHGQEWLATEMPGWWGVELLCLDTMRGGCPAALLEVPPGLILSGKPQVSLDFALRYRMRANQGDLERRVTVWMENYHWKVRC